VAVALQDGPLDDHPLDLRPKLSSTPDDCADALTRDLLRDLRHLRLGLVPAPHGADARTSSAQAAFAARSRASAATYRTVFWS
jgi:hypothetical protein